MSRREAMPERTKKTATTESTESPADLGDAAAVGEHSYAGPPETWPPDDRPPEEIAGTPEHLGGDEFPYAGEVPIAAPLS